MDYKSLNEQALNDEFVTSLLMGAGIKSVGGANQFYNALMRAKNVKNIADKRKDWGIAYRKASGNPEKAIEILNEKQKGFVPNATNNYGGIDFVWGKYTSPKKIDKKGGGYGLAHIKGRRYEDGDNGDEFLESIPELLDVGKKYFKEGHPGRFYIGTDTQEGAIRTDFNGKPRQWLDSAYYKNIDK